MNQVAETVSTPQTGVPQILLMEDESSVAKGLEMILKEEGYGVDLAITGQGALDTLKRKDFDLLVADLRLPDMDGMEVIKQVKDDKPDTEVIVITGYASVPSAVEAMKRGVVEYMPKPFTEDEFMDKVQQTLKERQEASSSELLDPADVSLEKDTMDASERIESAVKAHVLVMEDEPSVARGLELILLEEGYGVDLAMTGQEALDILGEEDVDLLVADLRLPDMDGMDVIRRLKEKRSDTEVIVITGYAAIPSAVEAMRTGAVDYLPKPFTEEQFLATVENAVRAGQKSLSQEPLQPIVTEAGEPIRIGFYAFNGKKQIAGKINVEELVDFVRKEAHVIAARDYAVVGHEKGLAAIQKDIRALGLNRVVIADCGPPDYRKIFQEACALEGLKPHHIHMIPLRDRVEWVTQDPLEANRKARALVAGVIHRAKYHRTLIARKVSVNPDVLVVGGGIAGMQAALDVAEAGHKAYLVEKQSTIGGHMLQFDKTFPTLDCAACIGTPKMVEVGQDPNIEVLTCSEVKEISGFVGNYRVKVHRNPRYVKEGVCTGCGECAAVCPIERPSDWDEGLGMRKAIYRSFPQAVPITFAIEKKDRAPCVTTCPAGVNVHGYIQLTAQGKYAEAMQRIMERIPLPGVLGRICPHPCESQCRRGEVDDALSIRELKRFVADQVDLHELPRPEITDRPEKVAVVGAGPAGLTVAYYLRLKGYQVTLFEALPELGGMLRVGIPDYRLPPEVLDREINYILGTGIEVRKNEKLGQAFTLADLKAQGFGAVFLGIGAHSGIKMNIPGEDATGVVDAADFLREVNMGSREFPGKRVVVIGGGNVAVDAARTARRLGAEDVRILYRRTREEMPAYAEEIEEALEEDVRIHYLTAPTRIHRANGKCRGIECIQTELGEPDATGRRRPLPVEGSQFVIDCDLIVPAIGQRPDMTGLENEIGLETSDWGTLVVNGQTMQTSIPQVFACGDAVTGPATVIEAIAAGHKAVEAIHCFINGEDLQGFAETSEKSEPTGRDWLELPKGLKKKSRKKVVTRDARERITLFQEVNAGLTEEAARQEAERCLNCGVCCECMECVRVCEANAIDHFMRPEKREIEVGTIIVATGYDLMDPSPLKEFGYGRYPNVFTSLEFERLNNATGPTEGKILMKDENGELTKPPESVAIIHCVGSRDENYHEYCSRVCCMYALKYGHLIKDKVGHHTKIYDFYVDMRCFGKGYEEFYRRCQDEGIIFFRGKPAEITDRALTPQEEGKLIVIGEDTLLNRQIRIPVDMVVLCSAIEARKDAAEAAGIFGINQGADGFFLEQHSKLAPLNTMNRGIFLAGACQGPKDIPDTVAQASGAAARALSLAIRGKVEIPSTIAWIDPEVCQGCLTCIKECAYSAIEFDVHKGVSVVQPFLCKGCGICVSSCPMGAAHVWQFCENQILTEQDGIMGELQVVGM